MECREKRGREREGRRGDMESERGDESGREEARRGGGGGEEENGEGKRKGAGRRNKRPLL